ncbi:UNVERIFIED_CONTAM: hypothetical protein RMT77_016102 [Armadillidium vulgare]
MIQPGGAMALFMLRLAGLLSLEKSLGENSTSLDVDGSDTLFHPQNISALFRVNDTNFYPNSDNTSEFNINKINFENQSLFVSNRSNEEYFDKISSTEKTFFDELFEKEYDSEIPVNVSKSPSKSEEFFRFRKIGRGTFDSIFKTSEIPNVPQRNTNTGFLPVILINKPNKTKTSPTLASTIGSILINKPNKTKKAPTLASTIGAVFFIDFENVTERSSDKGIYNPEFNITKITLNFSDVNSEKQNIPIVNRNSPETKENVRDLNPFITDVNQSILNINENFTDENKNTSNVNQNTLDLNQNISSSNFKISPSNQNISAEFLQTTTTRPFTFPVTQATDENTVPYIRKRGKSNRKNEGLQYSKSKSSKGKNKQTFKALSKRPESSTQRNFSRSISSKGRNFRPDASHHQFTNELPSNDSQQTELRNNPYPYGPKILPKSTASRHKYPNLGTISHTNPSITRESDLLFPDTDILYNFDDEIINLKETDDNKFEDEGEIDELEEDEELIDEGEELEIEGEDIYQPQLSSTEQNILVQTDKPTVLFHFEKPGYSPKVPEIALPPKRPPTPSDPWDCSPRCPNYSLLDWNQDYDVRQYPETTWISTVLIAENRIFAELEGYMRVQDYFYGLNDRGQLINLTVPFITQIKHSQHPGVLKELTDFSVSLFLNHLDQSLNRELPTPISNEVLVDQLESKIVFVTGFEANVWDVTEAFLETKALTLMDKLRQNGEAFLDRYYYLASYGRPELYQPVYYELWIYSTSFRDSTILSPPVAPRRRPPPSELTARVKSKLCRGVECPSFEVIRTYKYGIQKRRYFDGLFVTTSPGVCEFSTVSVWKGFMPLHLYKHGINSHLEVIEATRPIGLVHVREDSTPNTECPQNMTMAIYLPKRLHSNPPLTGYDAPPVSISALQDVVVYAYTVGGYLLEPHRVRKELADLKFRLTEFGACYKDNEYYVAVYDFIMRYHGRQNEIWIVAENCKATVNG